jgi:4-diphosphocytidyl-2-C-methyl-D-erythritol kinase
MSAGGLAFSGAFREPAPAKVNLLLHLGRRRDDGLHELCSLFASVDLFDSVHVTPSANGRDRVHCPSVDGPNICSAALDAFRSVAELPPVAVRIEKRIPVAAGLGGGSADAAAVLRVANRIADAPLGPDALRRVGASVGADVPSQVDPGHALVRGAGEVVERIGLPAMWLVLVPSREGLATAGVYAEADRLGIGRAWLDPAAARALAAAPLPELAQGLVNDLQPAALSLRPELEASLAGLRRAGALTALVTGSGPTVFGVFSDRDAARRAASSLPGSLVARLA